MLRILDFRHDGGDDQAAVVSAEGQATLVLPEEIRPFEADYSRSGPDLILTENGTKTLVVTNYFKSDPPPDLEAANGAHLDAKTVLILAGELGISEFAQVGNAATSVPIGQVETLSGGASVQRVDGTVEQLSQGAKIFQNDLLVTDASATVSVTFSDGTIFSLAASSRMVIDELVYSPSGSDNSGNFNLIQGGFVFIAGQVAKTGDMVVSTPSATMGIRGTNVSVDVVLNDGVATVTVALNPDPDSTIGEFILYDENGEIIAVVDRTDTMWIVSPVEGETREVPRTVEDFEDDSILIAEAVNAYRIANTRFDNGDPFVELGGSPNQAGQDGTPNDNNLGAPEEVVPEPLQPPDEDGNDPSQNGGGSEDDDASLLPEIDNLRLASAPVTASDLSVDGVEDAMGDQAIVGDLVPEGFSPDTVTLNVIENPQNGELVITDDGEFIYTPEPDFFGQDEFTYSVTTETGGTDIGTVMINLQPVNDAPEANTDSGLVSEDGMITFQPLLNDVDIDGDELTTVVVVSGENGRAVLNEDGTITYTPDPNFAGEDTFSYTVSDGQGGSSTGLVTVIVTPVNDAPVPANDATQTAEDTSVTIDPAADDSDIDSEDLTVTDVGEAAFGTVVLNPDGTITYTPNPNASGEDSFSYTVSDGEGETATGLVTVTVTAVNDAPEVADTTRAATEDGVAVDVLLADLGSDPDGEDDGETLSYEITGDPSGGTASIDGTTLSFDPGADFQDLSAGQTRDVQIEVTATDAQGETATGTVTVTVTGVNDAPNLDDGTGVATEDGAAVDIPLAGLGSDADGEDDGETLSYEVTGDPSGGTASIDGTTLSFDPGADFQDLSAGQTRDVEIEVTATDAQGETATSTVTVTVTGVNDAPD
ncbi:MAG: Ig-like domain-containing protein, partial [Pseudomonadota bacterium]